MADADQSQHSKGVQAPPHQLRQNPIAIPATTPKLGSPFLRAYPPCLEACNISRETFLNFLDDLNRTATASPPLQVLGLIGTVVSFVPLHTAQIVGGAVNAAATLSTIAISKGRTELFMRDANRKIFEPRGLKAQIAKIDALAKIAGIPILNEKGKVARNTSILTPLDWDDDITISGQQRRLAAVESWIAHLDLDPLPDVQTRRNPLSKLTAASSERNRRKGEKDMVKDRKDAYKKLGELEIDVLKVHQEFENEMAELDRKEVKCRRKLLSKPDELAKKLREIEKDRHKVKEEYEKELSKIEKDKVKEDKEQKGMRKVLWLIVTSSASDPNPNQAGPDI